MNEVFKKYYCCENCNNDFVVEIWQNIWTKRLISEKTGKIVSGTDTIFCPDCGSLKTKIIGSDPIL